MNQRNVEALRNIVRQFHASDDEVRNPAARIDDLLAKHLASHGVLAPSVLTEEEVWAVWTAPAEGPEPLYNVEHWKNLPAELGRIAKGEEAHSGV